MGVILTLNNNYFVGNFSATGTKSAVVNTSYGIRKLYAMESPNVLFNSRGKDKWNLCCRKSKGIFHCQMK